jgi:type VI secretion system protein ImpF
MPEIKPDQPLTASVLDRLIDLEPGATREAPRSRSQVLREVKQAVRRDLENLLNTRVRCVPWPAGLKEVRQSLVNYGIPDVSAGSLASDKERKEFCRTIEGVIGRFDSRLRKLKVTLVETPDPGDRTIRFHIEATLHAEPAVESLAFESSLRLSTGSFEVQGGDR